LGSPESLKSLNDGGCLLWNGETENYIVVERVAKEEVEYLATNCVSFRTSGGVAGYPAPWGKKYSCAPVNKNCRI